MAVVAALSRGIIAALAFGLGCSDMNGGSATPKTTTSGRGATGGAGGSVDASTTTSGAGGSSAPDASDEAPADANAMVDVVPEVREPAKPGPIAVTATAVEGPTRWKHDAKGAYTIIHDDTCGDKLTSHYALANQELASRDLHVGFGAIAGFCAGEADLLNQYLAAYFMANPQTIHEQWIDVRKLLANGHEIVNHTWSHTLDQEPNGLPAVDATRWHMEIDHARDLLEKNLGIRLGYFIFPYDERTDEQIAYLAAQGYSGARAGARMGDGFNPFDFPDAFRINFAVYHVEPGDVPNDLNSVVTNAIDKGGWGMREVHGVGDTADDGWEPIPVAQYRAHLDFLKQKVDAGDLWVDPPTAVTRYRFARTSCAPPTVSGNKLAFPSPADACRANATALTFRATVQTSQPIAELVAIQGTEYVKTVALAGGKYFVDADPTKGDVELSGR